MLNRIIDMFANLLETTGLARLDPSLSTVVSILAIAGALIGGIKWICRWLRWLTRQSPVDRLYMALIGHSVASKSEVIYQILSYIPPRFDKQDKQITFRQLLSQIKACSGEKQSAAAVFSVIGAPACGKTTTMRYLYCKLSKSRKCVYFQMQDVNMDSLGDYLEEQKMENHFENGSSVIAFFDGLDEAYAFFQEESSDSMEKAFQSIFFLGPNSKINEVFRDHNLHLDCAVVSLRPEFLEGSQNGLTELQYKNVSSNVYKILPLSNRDVIKIFKSLWILKKIEAHKKEAEPRHQNRYPAWWKTPYYTWLLRRILRNNPDCLFQYPMYIRYAYAFMQKYKEREFSGNQRAFSSNIAVSFDILLNAIIKWEFHIYFENKSVKKNQKEMDQFKQQIEACSEAIVLKLLENRSRYLPKEQFQSIVKNFFKDELSCLAMAHCFMVSDDAGMHFYFCHLTFYEYFLAKHLFEKADYHRRKKILYSLDASDYLRAMYYSILCRTEDLNNRITNTVKYTSNASLTLSRCQFLEKEGWMDIHDEPSISLVEILEYLPCINHFQYRGQDFTQEVLEDLIDCGNLNLSKTGWAYLRYAAGITPLKRVKILNINGLPLCDAVILKQCRNLKYLEMQYQSESDPVLESIIDTLSSLSLNWIHIKSTDGSLCRMVHGRLRTGTLLAQRVFVKTPNYSQAHLELYQLNQEWKELGLPARFYPSVRSDLEEAKKIFRKKDAEKDPKMLTAVFELEADEGGILGLFDKHPEATYWNGMSLAAYYKDKDSIDEDESASQLCRRLEPHIDKTNTELSVKFGYLYGKILYFRNEYAVADAWLTNTYRYGREHLSEKDIAVCGTHLYRARIRSGNREDLEVLVEDVGDRIKKLPEYQTDWVYGFYLRVYCADKLSTWHTGTPEPGGLREALTHYREFVAAKYKHGGDFFDSIKSVYFELLYANRVENLGLGEKTLEKMSQALEAFNEQPNTDLRNQQALWIQYHEQLLYLALLTDDREIVLDTVEKLLNYPCRRGDLLLKKYSRIQRAYQEAEHPDIDKHLLWDNVWF